MEIQWSLVLFTALTGGAGWMLACLAIDEFKGKAPKAAFMGALVAIIVLAVGGIASVTHLSHPENIMGALGHPTSGIFIEICLVGLTGLATLIYMILVKREAGAGARKAMAVLAAIFGVVLSFMAGESYMMASQPAWNTILMPLGYLGTAMPFGVAMYLLVASKFGDEGADLSLYAKFLMVAGIVATVTAAAFGFACGNLTAGMVFFVVCLLGSGLAAIALGFYASKAADKVFTFSICAVVCTLVGAICYRCMMWAVAGAIANFFGLI